MRKILLVALNAKYSHTSLAVRKLCNALSASGIPAAFAEYTINQPVQELLSSLAAAAPDMLLFSCYIWNIQLVQRLGADFRKLFPQADILLGGPEVSFEAEALLARMPWADAILCGEGEELLPQLLQTQQHPRGVYHPKRNVILREQPFAYPDLDKLQNRVLYYESTRGCFYGCAYCLSSADREVRPLPLPHVFADLQRFLDARVMQVKFVDRTFNQLEGRALAIWQYLIEHDNGVTSFQMELGGDLFTQEQLDLLRTARAGLFQFEIGVQSTCKEALRLAARPTNFAKLKWAVGQIRAMGNIHQHLDLIAGLPGEGFAQFMQSYNEVFALQPEQLQLGFLKLLRGSRLWAQREALGLLHSDAPPYEILQTPQLTYGELARIKRVEEMTERYYNSGRFTHSLRYTLQFCRSPFEGLLALGETMPTGAIGKYAYYELLHQFCVAQGGDAEKCRWLLKYDLCLHERPRKLPACCPENVLPPQWRRYLAEQFAHQNVHLELFPLDVTDPALPQQQTPLLFDYRTKVRRARLCNLSCPDVQEFRPPSETPMTPRCSPDGSRVCRSFGPRPKLL